MITKASTISLSYRFLKVFQTLSKTMISSQSQIESQIMLMLAKYTQALNIEWNTQQLMYWFNQRKCSHILSKVT